MTEAPGHEQIEEWCRWLRRQILYVKYGEVGLVIHLRDGKACFAEKILRVKEKPPPR